MDSCNPIRKRCLRSRPWCEELWDIVEIIQLSCGDSPNALFIKVLVATFKVIAWWIEEIYFGGGSRGIRLVNVPIGDHCVHPHFEMKTTFSWEENFRINHHVHCMVIFQTRYLLISNYVCLFVLYARLYPCRNICCSSNCII